MRFRRKKYNLPENEIVERLLNSSDTTRSLATEYGCSHATIKLIFRTHTTKEQRQNIKHAKQSATMKAKPLRGRKPRDPEKIKARSLLSYYVRCGRILKPDSCQVDGCDSDTRIESHHWMGYSRENALNVIWLCADHHRLIHKNPEMLSSFKLALD